MMKRKGIYLSFAILILIFLIVPIIINIVIVYKYPVDTTGGAWIGFWGSYLGGIITLMALLITLAINAHHQNIEQGRYKIERLKNELLQRITDLRLTQFLEKIVSTQNWQEKKEEHEYDLLRLSSQYQSQINSIDLLFYFYGITEASIDFTKQYKECLNNCIKSISFAIIAINSKKPKDLLAYISIQSISKEKEEIQKVKDAAYHLLDEMESKQKRLENTLWYKIVYHYIQGQSI